MRANALVVFPGGFGTIDELFDLLTLMQTAKMPAIPVVLVDKPYWSRVINFTTLVEEGMIAQTDLDLFSYADDAEAAWHELVRRGLNRGPRPAGYPFAVGTAVTGRPPHRTARAEFPHAAPTLGV